MESVGVRESAAGGSRSSTVAWSSVSTLLPKFLLSIYMGLSVRGRCRRPENLSAVPEGVGWKRRGEEADVVIHTPRYLVAHFDTKGVLVKDGSSSERVACANTSVIANWGLCASLGDFCSSWSQVEASPKVLCRVTWVLKHHMLVGVSQQARAFWPLSQIPREDLLSLT